MLLQKKISTLVGVIIIVAFAIVTVGGASAYQYFFNQEDQTTGLPPQILTKNYINIEYGFRMSFPDSWKGYFVGKDIWNGNSLVDDTKYNGLVFVFKNPKSIPGQPWQDIPIMVITPDIWEFIEAGQIAVSAAPIGPAKIGENKKYVFATPPRWYGFTDALGWQEAVEIVKTFKAF